MNGGESNFILASQSVKYPAYWAGQNRSAYLQTKTTMIVLVPMMAAPMRLVRMMRKIVF
jgi:hypothetical protein